MKISENGDVWDFCCDGFDHATLPPHKSISIQPLWKDHFLDKPHPRACLMVSKSGRAIDIKSGAVYDAGFNLLPISQCPYCEKEITFEVMARPFEKENEMEELRKLQKQGKINWVL